MNKEYTSLTMPVWDVKLQLLWNSIQKYRIHHQDQVVSGIFYQSLYCYTGELCNRTDRPHGRPYKHKEYSNKWAFTTADYDDLLVNDMLVGNALFKSNARVLNVIRLLKDSGNIFQVNCMVHNRPFNMASWLTWTTPISIDRLDRLDSYPDLSKREYLY